MFQYLDYFLEGMVKLLDYCIQFLKDVLFKPSKTPFSLNDGKEEK